MTQRKIGRPPLDARDPSTAVLVRMPSKQYDATYAKAAAARVSVPELIRRALTVDNKRYPK